MYKRLKELREDHDLTQSQISKYLNMSQTGYSNMKLVKMMFLQKF